MVLWYLIRVKFWFSPSVSASDSMIYNFTLKELYMNHTIGNCVWIMLQQYLEYIDELIFMDLHPRRFCFDFRSENFDCQSHTWALDLILFVFIMYKRFTWLDFQFLQHSCLKSRLVDPLPWIPYVILVKLIIICQRYFITGASFFTMCI
jgi:hypothetical protein